MTKLSTLLVATLAASIPAAGIAQTLANQAPVGLNRAAIAELGGPTRTVANWRALGLEPLPAGQSYGIKDSRIVVLDEAGAVLSIVRVVADLSSTDSGMSF